MWAVREVERCGLSASSSAPRWLPVLKVPVELAGLQTAGAGVLGSMSAPSPPIEAPGDLAAPMGDLQPVSGEASESSGGGGWLSWITGSGSVQKAEPQVTSACHIVSAARS